ncbi:MAG: SPOR domain-containing protein [Burkholderiales bacterium]
MGNTLIGIFIGLFLGLVIASAIAVYMMKSPLPFVSKSKAGDRASASEQPPRQRTDTKSAAAPVSDPRADKPTLDFYKILPGQESGPGAQSAQSRERPEAVEQVAALPKSQETLRETYVIQAGSFQNPADADNVKAKLALLGLQASIEPAALPDKGTWYRVRLGPYRNTSEINSVRQQLTQAGVTASLLKIKD